MKEVTPVAKAIEYIENHLHENIGLRDVSKEIGYSYYHMTRLFTSVLGESVGRYIQRRRLYVASEKLIHSNQRVIDIALASGFASPEAFSRAFKAAFSRSPLEYRRIGLDLVVNAKKGLAPEDVRHIANNISHSPKMVLWDDTPIAGLRGTTSLSDNRLPGLWAQFLGLQKEIFPESKVGYGICETQPNAYTKNGDVSFSAMVGCPVDCFAHLPPTLVRKTVRGGKYAVFTHRGDFGNLFKTYQYIFGVWLPSAKETLDNREDFEYYENEVLSFDDPQNEVKIFIPVK